MGVMNGSDLYPTHASEQPIYSNFQFKTTDTFTPAPAVTNAPQTNIASWMRIEDYATQIRILALQARYDDSVSAEQIQGAFDLTNNIQNQLRTLMHQKTGFTFPVPSQDGITMDPVTKKRKRGDSDRTCHSCATSETPEWRRGPNGPRTLCNACGLKWAKKRRTDEKQNTSPSDTAESTISLPSLPTINSNSVDQTQIKEEEKL